MAKVVPFLCMRPAAEKAEQMAALPYDVYTTGEAREAVKRNPQSFLAVDRAETQFPVGVNLYADCVYEKAADLLSVWKQDGTLVRETEKSYYVYELTMDGRVQTGIVAGVSIDDYVEGKVRRHENTREEKEKDRIRHITACQAQTGPVFLIYRGHAAAIHAAADRAKQGVPLYDFTAEDGIRHRVFRIAQAQEQADIERAFAGIEQLYIADGHHRAAAAVQVGFNCRVAHPDYTGEEEFNYFLSVLFSEEEVQPMEYNRVVRDLNGLSKEAFFRRLQEIYIVRGRWKGICPLLSADADETEGSLRFVPDIRPVSRPQKKGELFLFLGNHWYCCEMRAENLSDDVIGRLDVSVLQNRLLAPVLGIADPKTDQRVDFVGGICGLKELECRCRQDCAAAFALYPVSLQELFAVADAGLLMPPKSTWFEPKLRSGLFIYELQPDVRNP